MNSIERVLAALTFGNANYGEPDRVPVLPVPLMQGALVYECSPAEYFAMPAQKIADAQVKLNEMFNGIPDGVAGIPHVIEDVTAFGVKLDSHYANSSPAVGGMLIREFADIDSLRVPIVHQSAQLMKTRDTITALRSSIGDQKLVIGACIAPFSLPSMLMGTSKWMRLLFTPEIRNKHYRHIIDVCTEFVVGWANLQLEAGAHVIVLADGMASASLLPRKMFEELAKPVIQSTISQINGFVAYEGVGRLEPFIDLCGDLGAVALLIGEEDDISTCKRILAGQVGLIGNVNNMKMRRWSPARIELKAKQAIMQGKDGFGFILANQGPEIPFDVSVDGIRALIEAVEKYGYYSTAVTSA